jgi:inositol oxygenase
LRVIDHYQKMRSKQTVAFVKRMQEKFSWTDEGVGRREMTIEEAFAELESYVDASDPDLDLPNKIHLLQTAEGIRKAGHPEWLQLTGLLHDMGKIMFLWGDNDDGLNGHDPKGDQWALGGDTFVVGCALPEGDAIVFPEFNHLNPDMADDRYSSKFGVYEPHCGLDALDMAWGHDEYMYRMLVANNCTLPKEGLDMIRYHSCYPWHDKAQYKHLLLPEDEDTLEWVQLFNAFDLYTKDEGNVIHVQEVWPYYKNLLNKFGLGGKLWW